MNTSYPQSPEHEQDKLPMAVRPETVGAARRFVHAAFYAEFTATLPVEERVVASSVLKDTVAYTPETAGPTVAQEGTVLTDQEELIKRSRGELDAFFEKAA